MPKESAKKSPSTKSGTKKTTSTKTSSKSITTKTTSAQKQSVQKKKTSSPQKLKTPSVKQISSTAAKPTSQEKKVPLWVWIFFGCALLLFCYSVYMSLTGSKDDNQENWIEHLNNKNSDTLTPDSNQTSGVNPSVNEYIITPPTPNQEKIVSLFYQKFSEKDINGLYDLLDAPLKKSTNFTSFFNDLRIKTFIDNIEGNSLVPSEITHESTSESGLEDYLYNIKYTLANTDKSFDEDWIITLKKVGDDYKVARIYCVTERCSFNPFFWPQNYGLL